MYHNSTIFLAVLALLSGHASTSAFSPKSQQKLQGSLSVASDSIVSPEPASTSSSKAQWFANDESSQLSTEQLKAQVLQLGAALDRGKFI